jgi:hypothetical protein
MKRSTSCLSDDDDEVSKQPTQKGKKKLKRELEIKRRRKEKRTKERRGDYLIEAAQNQPRSKMTWENFWLVATADIKSNVKRSVHAPDRKVGIKQIFEKAAAQMLINIDESLAEADATLMEATISGNYNVLTPSSTAITPKVTLHFLLLLSCLRSRIFCSRIEHIILDLAIIK